MIYMVKKGKKKKKLESLKIQIKQLFYSYIIITIYKKGLFSEPTYLQMYRLLSSIIIR